MSRRIVDWIPIGWLRVVPCEADGSHQSIKTCIEPEDPRFE